MLAASPTMLVVCGSPLLPALSTDKDNVGTLACTHTLATDAVVIVIVTVMVVAFVIIVAPFLSNCDYTASKAKYAYVRSQFSPQRLSLVGLLFSRS